MSNRKSDAIIGLVLLIIVIFLYWFGRSLSPVTQISPDETTIGKIAEKYIPETKFLINHKTPINYFEIRDSNNEGKGFIILSDELGTTKTGYGGKVPLIILTNSSGKILHIEIGKNSETPAYIEMIQSQGLFDNLKNYNPAKNIQIDSISGATFSSTAIIEGSIKSVQKLYSSVIANGSEPIKEKTFKINWIAILSLVVFFLLVIISLIPSMYKFRRYWMIFSVVVLGFVFQRFFSLSDVLKLISGQFPSGEYFIIWSIFVGSVLVITIIWGRVFCWHICPYGTLLELLTCWRKRQIKLPQKVTFKIGWLKFILLGISSFIVGYQLNFKFLSYEPFSLMFRPKDWLLAWQNEKSAVIVILCSIIIGLIISPAWCSFFCPAGAFFNILSRFKIINKGRQCKNRCATPCTDDEFNCASCKTNEKILSKCQKMNNKS